MIETSINANEQDLQNSFNIFKRIGDSISRYKEVKTVDKLLDEDLLFTIFEEINNGYKLTQSQQEFFDLKLLKSIRNTYDIFEELLANGFYLPDRYLGNLAFAQPIFFKNALEIYNDPEPYDPTGLGYNFIEIKKLVAEKMNSNKMGEILLDTWTRIIERGATKKDKSMDGYPFYEYADIKIMDAYKQFKEPMLGAATNEKLTQCIDYLEKVKKRNDCIRQVVMDHIIQELKEALQNNNNFFIKNQNEFATHSLHTILRQNFQQLPNTILEKVRYVESQYLEIRANKNRLSVEEKLLVDNMFQNTLPKVLSEYVSIPLKHREALTNAVNKSATDLIIDSLTDINDIMGSVIYNINERKVSQLSVNHRYLHEVKKG